MKRRDIIILTSTILALVVLAGGYFFLQSQFLLKRIRDVLETQISKKIDHEVKIGKLSGNVLLKLTAEDVAILRAKPEAGSHDKKADNAIIAAESIDLDYKLWGLLRGKFWVDELSFQKLLVNAEVDENGELNLNALIPEREGTATPSKESSLFNLVGMEKLRIKDGELNYIDKKADANLKVKGFSVTLDGPIDSWDHEGELYFDDGNIELNAGEKKINVPIHVPGEQPLRFHLLRDKGEIKQLRVNMGDSSWVEATATAGMDGSSLVAQMTSELHLTDIRSFLPPHEYVDGVATISINATGTLSEIAGDFDLSLPVSRLNNLQVEELHIGARFNQDSFEVTNLSGKIASGTLAGKAKIELVNGEVDYEAEVNLASLNPEQLLVMLTSQEIVRTHEMKEQEREGGKEDEDLKLMTSALNGEPLPTRHSSFVIRHSELDGNFRLKGNGSDLANLESKGEVKLSQGEVNDVPFQVFSADYELKNDAITVDANFDGATASLTGNLGLAGPTDLLLGLTKVNLEKMSTILGLPKLAGSGRAKASITGGGFVDRGGTKGARKPISINAEFETDVAYMDVPIGKVVGRVNYAPDKVILERISLNNKTTNCSLTGEVTLADAPVVDLKIALQPLLLDSYMGILGDSTPIAGSIAGEISIHGKLDELDGKASLEVTRGEAWGLQLAPFAVALNLEDNAIRIPELSLSSNGDKIHLSLYFAPDGDYDFNLTAEKFSLAKLVEIYHLNLPLTGFGDLTASGRGNIANPAAFIILRLAKVRYATQEIGEITLNGKFHNRGLEFDGVGFSNACQIKGSVSNLPNGNVASLPYEITLKLGKTASSIGAEDEPPNIATDSLDLSPFLGLANLRDIISGSVDGVIQLSGDLISPLDSTGKITLHNLTLNTQHHKLFTPKPVEIDYFNQTAYVKAFELLSGDKSANLLEGEQFIKMHGSLSQRRLDFTIASEEFNLAIVNDLLTPSAFRGVGSYELKVKNTPENPVITLSWELPEVTISHPVQPILLTNINGSLLYKDKLLHLDRASLQFYDNFVWLMGDIPVDLAFVPMPVEERVPDGQINLHLISNHFLLDNLPQYSPDVSAITGGVKIATTMSGNILQPRLTGSVAFVDFGLTSPKLPQPISNLRGLLQFRGQLDSKVSTENASDKEPSLAVVDLKRLEWQIGAGDYTAFGSLRLPEIQTGMAEIFSNKLGDVLSEVNSSLSQPEFNFTLLADNVDLGSPVKYLINNPNLPFEGNASLFARLNGKGLKPTDLIAQIIVDDMSLRTPEVHELSNLGKILLSLKEGRFQVDSFRLFDKSEKQSSDEVHVSLPLSELGSGINPSAFEMRGSVDIEENIDLHLESDKFDLAVIYPLLKPVIHITSSPRPLSGFASFDIRVKGTMTAPVIDSAWELLEVGMQETKVDSIVGETSYRDETLDIKQILVKGFGNELKVKGKMPLNLALAPVGERFLDKPVDIDISGEDIDFAFITSLSKRVQEANGFADIDLRIRGTSAKPHLEGAVLVKDGRMSFYNFDVPIILGDIILAASEGKIQSDKFNFALGAGRCITEVHLDMDGLLPDKLVLDAFDAHDIQIADFARNFLKREPARKISGHVSANTMGIQVNLRELLARVNQEVSEKSNSVQLINGQEEKGMPNPFAFLRSVSGELIITNLLLKLAGHDIQPQREIGILLQDEILACSFELREREPKDEYDNYEPFNLTAIGHWAFDDKLTFDLDGSVDAALIEEFMPKDVRKELKGKFEYKLKLQGVADNPQMTFNWKTKNLTIERAGVDTFTGTIKYANQELLIEEIQAMIGKNDARLSGVIPFQVSLLQMRGGFPDDKKSRLTLDAKFNDLKFVPLIDSNYTYAGGDGSLNITVGGDIREPDFFGHAEFNNVNLKMLSANLEFRKTNIQLSLQKKQVQIIKFKGMLNDGNYDINGYVGLPKYDQPSSEYLPLELALRGNWSDCTFSQIDLYSIKCSGEAKLTGQLKRPRLEGNAIITEGEYREHWRRLIGEMFKSDIDVKSEVYFDYPVLRDLEVDFDVQAPGNLRLNTPGLAIIETSAAGKLLGPLNNLIFVGQVDILQGDIWYFEHQFNVKEGRVYNDTPQGKFNPQYEIRAETPEQEPLKNIPLFDAGEEQIKYKNLLVLVQMKGDLEKPGEPGLRAEVLDNDPGEKYELDREQIISILTVGIPELSYLNGSISDTASELIRKRTEWYLSSMFAGKLGLRELKFDISPDAFEESRFLFTKELTQKWAITYSSTLELHKEQRIETEYELFKEENKNISVAGELDKEGQWGVDLKLEYKFK